MTPEEKQTWINRRVSGLLRFYTRPRFEDCSEEVLEMACDRIARLEFYIRERNGLNDMQIDELTLGTALDEI